MKHEPIRTRSFVYGKDGEPINTDDLSPTQRQKLANWLHCNILNSLFSGQAVFTPIEPDGEEGIGA